MTPPPALCRPLRYGATATVAATVGEWLQVHHRKYGRVHVSCPVGWRTQATLTIHDDVPGQDLIKTRPAHWGQPGEAIPLGHKALEMLGQLCAIHKIPCNRVALRITSDLPEGKGFATSTSDLVAIATAFGHALGEPLPAETIHQLAIGIEASDATMFPGIVTATLDHPGVLAVHPISPPVVFVTVIPEGTMATEDQPPSTPSADADRLLRAMGTALDAQDVKAMGRLGTESAAMAQTRITTPHWDLVNAIAAEFEAVGVIIGHSGTLSALVCDTRHRHHGDRLNALTDTLAQETNAPVATITPDLDGPTGIALRPDQD